MDPFRLALSFGPLAIYLLVIGRINLRRQPSVVSGGRDVAALALALAGLLIVGPIELFMPRAAMAVYGPMAWAMAAGMYALAAFLCVLTARPRLTIYNCRPQLAREILAEVLPRLDSGAHFAGDAVMMPALDVHFQIESLPPMRNTMLAALGDRQSLAGWRALEAELAAALAKRDVAANPAGAALAAVGLALLFMVGSRWAADPRAVADSMEQMLRLPSAMTWNESPDDERPGDQADSPSTLGAS